MRNAQVAGILARILWAIVLFVGTLSCVSSVEAAGPDIEVFEGPSQFFGHLGRPQKWINIVGNVSDPDGDALTSLTYSLNGLPEVAISIGKNGNLRLVRDGDFNVEIDADDLTAGVNTVVIRAVDDNSEQSQTTVTVNYVSGNVWPLPYSIDWTGATAISDVAQVVDGRWTLDGDGVRIIDDGYDRLIAIGDMTWEDYEIEARVTFQNLGLGVGFLHRWLGHNETPPHVPGMIPRLGFRPIGALAWFRDRTSYPAPRLEISDGFEVVKALSGEGFIQAGNTYWFRSRVQTVPSGVLYTLKAWEDGQSEHSGVNLQAVDQTPDALPAGSVLLVAYSTKATFGPVTIRPVQNIPAALDDIGPTSTDTPVVIDVLANDVDSDGVLVPSSLLVTRTPANGATTVDAVTGLVTYTPDLGYSGVDTFMYTVQDDVGQVSNEATVVVAVTPVPGAPVSDDFSLGVLDTSLWTLLDPQSDASLSFTNTNVQLSVPGGSSHDLWTNRLFAPRLLQNISDDDFEVEVKFDSPVTSRFQYQGLVAQQDEQNLVRVDVQHNGTQANAFAGKIKSGNGEFIDSATISGTAPVYLRLKRVANSWTFKYSQDGQNWTTVRAFNHIMTVNQVGIYVGNHGNPASTSPSHMGSIDYFFNTLSPIDPEDVGTPVAVDDSAFTDIDVSVDIDVLINDSDSDGFLVPSTVLVTSGPSNGTTSVNPTTGIVTYTPDLGFFGAIDTFTYTVQDNDAHVSNAATVSVTVGNQPPTANDDSASTDQDVSVAIDVLANDVDSDGVLVPSTVLVTSGPSNGTTNVDPVTGVVTYTPSSGFVGTDTLTYTVEDNSTNVSNAATVTVTVLAVNQPPTANDDSTTTNTDVAVAIDVLANDTDSDGVLVPSTVLVASGPSNGTTNVDPVTGVVTYTPSSGFVGTDMFTYTVEDDSANVSNAATVTVTVLAVNQPPTANDDSASTGIDTAVAIDVLANDVDIDGVLVPSTVLVASGPSNGTTSVDPVSGVVTYTPSLGFVGTDTFTYTVEDDSADVSNLATVTVTVSGAGNQPPTANDDSASTDQDVSVAIDVLANDVDTDGVLVPSTVLVTSDPRDGTTSVDPVTGVVTYTPSSGFVGVDTFMYTVEDDSTNVSNTATVTITVVAVGNQPPTANDDSASTDQDVSVAIDVLANDTDSDGVLVPSTVLVASGPSNGATSVDPVTGVVTYTPSTGFLGTDTFTYTVEDDSTNISNAATVTVTVTAVNQPPTANDDSVITSIDLAVAIDVLANDVDIDGVLVPSTVLVASGPNNGTTSVDPVTGAVTYTPSTGFLGTDTFTYTVEDDSTNISNAATVTVRVEDVGGAPVSDDFSTGTLNTSLWTLLDPKADASLSFTGTNIELFVPGGTSHDLWTNRLFAPRLLQDVSDDDFEVEVKFDSPVTDRFQLQGITVQQDGLNLIRAEVFHNGTSVRIFAAQFTAGVGQTVISNTISVNSPVYLRLARVGDSWTFRYSADGLVWITAGTFNHVMAVSQVGFHVGNHGSPASSIPAHTGSVDYFFNTASPIVPGDSGIPTANDDSSSTDEDVAVAIDVLANDTDSDGVLVPSSVLVTSGPSNGTTSVDPVTGVVTYTPSSGFLGTDTFTYTVEDDQANVSNTATVTVTVLVVGNQPPTANDDATSTDEDVAVAIDVLTNDTDSDGVLVPSSVLVTSGPNNGTTSVDPVTGVVTYTPSSGFVGTDTFTYTVEDDSTNVSNVATVTITVLDVDQPPTANDDTASTDEDVAVAIDVLANDTDSDGVLVPSSVLVASGPSNGTTSVDPVTGVVTYTPSTGFAGTDTFTYTVEDDGTNVSNAATVTVTILDVNQPPTANDDTASTDEDVAVAIDVLANDTDSDGVLVPSSVLVTSGPNNGTTSVDPVTGIVTYTPLSGFVGADTFTYTVEDDTANVSNIATVTITVLAGNQPPTANDDTASTDEDVAVAIDVLANDTDSDGVLVPSSVQVVGGPSNGTTSVDPVTGIVTYTPLLGFVGTDTFTYTVEDDTANVSNIATVTITVLVGNQPPTANDDAASTDEDVAVAIDVLANDTDSDGVLVPSSVLVTSGPSNGTTSVDPVTGIVTYTPLSGFVGTDTFTYTVEDESTNVSNVATVTVTVLDVDQPPTANDDAASTDEDVAVAIDVLANDTDSDGVLVPSSVLVTSGPSNGTTSVDPVTGVVTYTPSTGFVGTDTFTYTVEDDVTNVSNAATVTVTVLDVNQPPTANDDTASTDEDVAVAIDVLANDTDSDGVLVPSSVLVTSGPSNGTTSVDPVTGIVTYTPLSGFVGTDTFTYTVEDDSTNVSNAATVTVTVQDVNQPPTANDDTASTDEDVAVAIDVLANDTDSDGVLVPSSVLVTSGPSNGTTSVDPVTGIVTYTPLSGFVGTDTFTYTVEDDSTNVSNAATVTVTVQDVNQPPTANDDSSSTDEDVAVAIDVLANDTDSDGVLVPSSVLVVSGPSNGTTSVDPVTGVVTYTPSTGFVGTDTFTYTVEDNSTNVSNAATVTVTVQDVNQPPTANDDTASTDEDVAVAIDVLANDTDSDGVLVPSSVLVVSGPSNGTTSVDSVTGVVTYTPSTGFAGTDTFTYTVEDDTTNVSNVATVTVTVLAAGNQPPTANDDSSSTDEDVAVAIDVLANDTDSDGVLVPSSVLIVSGPSNGTTSVDPVTGVVTYTPSSGFVGTDTFTYTVEDDSTNVSNVATVTVTVLDVNQPPTANDDSSSTDEDVAVGIDVLANDTDSDGVLVPSSVLVVSGPSNGTTSVDPVTGVVTYTPSSGFVGTDTFTYTVEDNSANVSNAATVTVTVLDVNQPPTANDDSSSTDEDVAVAIDVLANDTDSDGVLVPSSVLVASGPSNGTTSVDPVTGVVTYTPLSGFVGTDTFTYTVEDDSANISNAATVTVTVLDVNQPPTANDDTASTDEDVAVAIDVLVNDTDSDGVLVPSSVLVASGPSNGTTSVDPVTGVVTYTPSTGFVGTDTFTYTVEDDSANISNAATVTVTVLDVNQPPTANDDTASTDEDVAVAIDVLVNDTDSDGVLVPSSVLVASGPSNGTTSVDPATGIVTYTPLSGFAGTDTFTYTVEDDSTNVSNAATVTVTVLTGNQPPTANDDSSSTDEDVAVAIDVLANDTDSDGVLVPSSVLVTGGPSNGTTSVDPVTGIVTYTPLLGFVGTDTFTYTVEDDSANVSNAATVTVTVLAGNQPPTANDDSSSTDEDVAVAIDVLANDIDSDGVLVPSSVLVTSGPSNGTTSVDPVTGIVTYTPLSGFAGTDTFTYTVEDNSTNVSNAATVTVTVQDVNQPPTANDDSSSTDEDVAVAIDVLANDTDSDGVLVPSSVLVASGPSNGTTSVDPVTGVVTYTPSSGFVGTDTFTYTVEDDSANVSNAATVTVTVLDVNQPPTANDDTASTDAGLAIAIDVLTNDVDSDGVLVPSSVLVTSGPSDGTTGVDPVTGVVTYTPSPGFVGTDAFTYTVEDDTANISNTATVTVAVLAVNQPPTANDDSATTNVDLASAIDVLANDTDSDGVLVPSSVLVTGGPSNGTTSVDPVSGVVTYTPSSGFVGADTFTYTVEDNSANVSNVATVSVTVLAVNQPPTANDDSATTDTDVAVAIDILANDTDVDGVLVPSSVLVVSGPSNGATSVDPVTAVATYTPSSGFVGTDTFTYTVEDNSANISNVATVTVTVLAVNQPPTANDDSATTDADVAVAIDVLANDTDSDGVLVPSSVLVASGPSNGTTSVDPVTGVVTYTPSLGFVGQDVFTYTVEDDSTNVSNAATVTVTVIAQAGAPVSDDFSTGVLDTTLWTLFDPKADSSLSFTSTNVELTAPGGTSHDLWTNRLFAPRLLQDVSDDDFEVEVKFDSAVTDRYQMQGIVVQQDGLNLIRAEVFSNGSSVRIFAAQITAGVAQGLINMAISINSPVYLRLARVGDSWTLGYSADGQVWTTAGTFNHTMTVNQVGFHVANHGNPASSIPAHTGSVDYFFNTASPIVNQD